MVVMYVFAALATKNGRYGTSLRCAPYVWYSDNLNETKELVKKHFLELLSDDGYDVEVTHTSVDDQAMIDYLKLKGLI